MRKKYPSKILLFGEYAILLKGEALAVPYPKFTAYWVEKTESDSAFKPYLLQYADYLFSENYFLEIIDVTAFKNALESGLDIKSNIPIGYGAGSSGALVAAVYERFAKAPIDKNDFLALKNVLGRMEDFFHSKSSGFDPLVCYLNKPLHIHADGSIHSIEKEIPLLEHMQLFNTAINRFTNQLVETFQERMKDEDYRTEIFETLLQLNSDCISYLLSDNRNMFFETLRKLSEFQLKYFNFAIPPIIQGIWKNKLTHDTLIMKLCGAGGGGFMIEFKE
ncbi:MAG: hypothetical protein IPG60_03345 [Bacteroidetes bacterium]|nr:hypothetical protein [Bacteroidota bacterium]MBP7398790.1 hypothetical protein [Chitinophagales bacterium]MBK7108517.1 hypothetical protein [Bacteroidota bacterium]MBK8489160.1 hypothetical protein [Bacteroidota bacterium]MBK8681009.1 hypothetical protein [Bacteroidota bacterium]